MSSRPLEGRIAVITGASKGFGRVIANALASQGIHLALFSRNTAMLAEVEAELRPSGVQVLCVTGDVTSEEDVRRFERETIARFGKVHILINNAGVNIRKPVTDFTLAEWRTVVDTNLTGAFLITRSFVPWMKGQGYGRILNLTSIMSHIALPQRTAYAASKTGLLGFTKALALELAPERITVNGISPGPFATEMNAPLLNNPTANADFLSRIPLGRWGEPADIGKLVLYLCSEDAGFITGTDLLIDGGWTAQ
jgi:NAD(P)-dependent dehydrogenase (short-subunit alcohol dehydrogenase family)